MLADEVVEVGGAGEADLGGNGFDAKVGFAQQFLDLVLAQAVEGLFGTFATGFVEQAPQVGDGDMHELGGIFDGGTLVHTRGKPGQGLIGFAVGIRFAGQGLEINAAQGNQTQFVQNGILPERDKLGGLDHRFQGQIGQLADAGAILVRERFLVVGLRTELRLQFHGDGGEVEDGALGRSAPVAAKAKGWRKRPKRRGMPGDGWSGCIQIDSDIARQQAPELPGRTLFAFDWVLIKSPYAFICINEHVSTLNPVSEINKYLIGLNMFRSRNEMLVSLLETMDEWARWKLI